MYEKTGEWMEIIYDDVRWREYVKGHIDERAFSDALKRSSGAATDRAHLGEIVHAYARWAPVNHNDFHVEGTDFTLLDRDKPESGAFPVTFAELKLIETVPIQVHRGGH